MAITNIGYDGTVNDIGFAQMQQHSGNLLPVVCGRGDFAVTINGAATRTCNVAVGSAYAPGVLSTSDAIESAVFDIVSTTGQTRWDAVVIRRNWATGDADSGTTIEVVKGTAAASAPMVLPSGVDTVLDSSLDQVLALVQITNGQPLPTAVVDRRVWASKVFTVPSVSALPTASVALYGVEVVVGTTRYRCLSDASNNPAWLPSGATVTTTGFGSSATGFTTAGQTNQYTVSADGTEVQYDLELRRTGASLQMDAAGNIGDTPVFTASGIKPSRTVPIVFMGRGGSTSTATTFLAFFGQMDASGVVSVGSGLPNQWLTQQASTGVFSLIACIKFTKGS